MAPTPSLGHLCKFQSWSPWPITHSLGHQCKFQSWSPWPHPFPLGTYADFKVGGRGPAPFSRPRMQISKSTTVAPPLFSWAPMQIPMLVTVAPPLLLGTYAHLKVDHCGPTPPLGYLCKSPRLKYAFRSPMPTVKKGSMAPFPFSWVPMQIKSWPPWPHPLLLGTNANFKVCHRGHTPLSWATKQISKLVAVAPRPSRGHPCKFRSWSPWPHHLLLGTYANFKVGHRDPAHFSWVLIANFKVGHHGPTPFSWTSMQISKLVAVAHPLRLGAYAISKVGHRGPTRFSWVPMQIRKLVTVAPRPSLRHLCNFQRWPLWLHPLLLDTYAIFKVGHHGHTRFSWAPMQSSKLVTVGPRPSLGHPCKFQS
jgi:hypothetical protein